MGETIKLIIDGQEIKAKKGQTILEAAEEAGIYIPSLCYHPDLKPPSGVCRICMVEIKGRGLTIACRTPVEEGMVVRTESPEIDKVRRIAVELIIMDHQADCLACAKNYQCKLQRIAAYVGVRQERLERLRKTRRVLPVDDSNPFFIRDPNKCVLCGICVRTCKEIQGVGAIHFSFRGLDTIISTFAKKPILESVCESCGECVARCPVGALIPKEMRQPVREVKTICPYCGVGCGIYLGVRGNLIVSVHGDRNNPVNNGNLCVKGRFGYKFINHPERLTSPLIRRNGEFVKVSWEEALDYVAGKLANYKGDQFALISSAKCTNEENYVIQKFVRAVMGTNNIDCCARLCHAPSVAALVMTLGSGAMSNSINELSNTACILAIGTNTTETHPVTALEVKKAVQKGAKLIVINPIRIDLCHFAHLFLQLRPGTDVALLMGMARVIVEEGLIDTNFIKERCENFDAFKESLKRFDLDFVEKITGVPREQIVEAARIYATHKPACILWGMGITQHSHGTDNALAITNLALLTGNIGKPSSGLYPLRGQNNVQGACDMGNLPAFYPGYQRVADLEVRKKFETAWSCNLNPKPGLTIQEILLGAYRREIKALYVVGANPALTSACVRVSQGALEEVEFLVVHDIFLTETARFAHVVLPALTFAEKDGTFTNTERRVQLIRKAIEPVGEGRPDWWIICEIAKRMGAKGFNYNSPAEIMKEIAFLVPDFGGISYERLENGGLQWPCPTPDHPGTPILHIEKFPTPTGKGRFSPLEYKPPAELPDSEYPLTLTTGRCLQQYHTGSMSRRVEGLNVLRAHEWVEINPQDAAALGLSTGDMVRVISRRGEVIAKAKVTDTSPPSVVSMTFHFPETPTNALTNPVLDPVSKTPELKVCAVRIEKVKDA